MVKKTIAYTDFDGNPQEDTWWFNLSKAEVMEMEMSLSGGLSKMLEQIVEEKNAPKMVAVFKEIILKSVGKKSADGKRLMKNDELRAEFLESEAYSTLFMELVSSTEAIEAFIQGVLPPVDPNAVKQIPNK